MEETKLKVNYHVRMQDDLDMELPFANFLFMEEVEGQILVGVHRSLREQQGLYIKSLIGPQMEDDGEWHLQILLVRIENPGFKIGETIVYPNGLNRDLM